MYTSPERVRALLFYNNIVQRSRVRVCESVFYCMCVCVSIMIITIILSGALCPAPRGSRVIWRSVVCAAAVLYLYARTDPSR